MKNLRDYSKNIYSQFGEDGIIEEIMKQLRIDKGHCIDIGASDLYVNSNIGNLLIKHKWTGMLYEANKDKSIKLIQDCQTEKIDEFTGIINDSITCDNIIKYLSVNGNIDLLSLDVDGNEYHLVKKLMEHEKYPKVMVIEYNPSIPFFLELIPPENSSLGCSLLALINLLKDKYQFIGCTDTNGFFIKTSIAYYHWSIAQWMGQLNKNLSEVAINKYLSFTISDYQGRIKEISLGHPYPWSRGRGEINEELMIKGY